MKYPFEEFSLKLDSGERTDKYFVSNMLISLNKNKLQDEILKY